MLDHLYVELPGRPESLHYTCTASCLLEPSSLCELA